MSEQATDDLEFTEDELKARPIIAKALWRIANAEREFESVEDRTSAYAAERAPYSVMAKKLIRRLKTRGISLVSEKETV